MRWTSARRADRIGGAARERDRAGVETELGATLQTCVSCHATWKQKVVGVEEWRRRTNSEPPHHGP